MESERVGEIKKAIGDFKWYILSAGPWILLVIIMLFILINPVIQKNPSIGYYNISPEEKIKIENMLEEVKPLYLDSSWKINFVSNNSYMNRLNINGVNNLGFITIVWTDDMDWNKQVICHELAHNFLGITKEKFSYDLGSTLFCFEERKLMEVEIE